MAARRSAGFMNTHRGKDKFKNFRIFLDNICSSTIVMRRPTTKLKA